MNAECKTITLSDGTEVELRVLGRADYAELAFRDPVFHRLICGHAGQLAENPQARPKVVEFVLALMARAVVKPYLEVEGQAPVTPQEGTVHVLDLDDADFDLLNAAVLEFSLREPGLTLH